MIKKIISKAVRNAILRSGYAEQIALNSMRTILALKRVRSRGVEINSVLDIGASTGSWSIVASKCWPNAHCHLVEANTHHKPALEAVCQKRTGFSYVLAAASDVSGTVFFDGTDPFGGLAMKANDRKPGSHSVAAVTLDGEAKRLGLKGPYLIKLDTHGFEVPILNGAKAVLADANLVVIETYNFQIEPNSLKFFQMCQFMDDLGFAVIDISEPMWRTKDNAFWQIDLFFIPKSRPEFSYNRYA